MRAALYCKELVGEAGGVESGGSFLYSGERGVLKTLDLIEENSQKKKKKKEKETG